jgi:4-hydroxybenzoate polyprenyltransferase
LPHVVPILAVLTATAAFALVASRGWPGTVDLVCLLGAMFGGQLAVGAVNEIVDADLDAVARPSKPIPAGLVSRRGAMTMVLGGLALMVLLSLRFSPGALLLCASGNGAGIAYSLWFKRTLWSWLPYVVAVPLIPIWVWTALDTFPAQLLVIYPLGIPAVISLQVAQSMPDIASDRASGVQTLAVAMGARRAPWVCWGLMLLSLVFATVMAESFTERPGWVWATCLVAALLVAGNVALWRHDAHRGVMSAFPMIAAAAVALGVGWTLAAIGA